MIPVEYRIHGDRMKCDALRGQARRVSHILDNMVRLGDLKQQEFRFVPYDGAVIIARHFFGKRIIDIYAGGGVPLPPQPEVQLCVCNCNFSVGWVLEVQAETIQGAPLYTIMACNYDGTAYMPYENVLASDYTPYEVGQKIIMIPYNHMTYLCCTDKTGGEEKVRGCTPLAQTVDTTSDEWRSIYRILPWCAIKVPMQLNPSEWNHRG